MTRRRDHPDVRIALVTDTYAPQVNGVTTVCRRVVRVVRAAGHAAVVVAPAYPGAPAEPDGDELRIPSVPFPPYPQIRLSLPRHRTVRGFLDAFRPDLVHVATEGPLGALGRGYALRRRVPLVTSFHTHFAQYFRYYGAGVLSPVVWRWLIRFHEPARLTHTPGEAVRDELAARGIQHAVVWGRGVDTDHFRPERRSPGWRRWLAGGEDSVIVLHVGRLAREKNLGTLATAFLDAHARLGQRATFAIAGEGPGRRQLMARLPFARQLGFLDPAALATLYASADLCVLPSFTETCGLIALEAMASGLPVVAADAGGLRESVRHGHNGLLVPPRDAAAFAAATVELAIDPARRLDCRDGRPVQDHRDPRRLAAGGDDARLRCTADVRVASSRGPYCSAISLQACYTSAVCA
ncbi:MAG: glycosyltransferase family 4 protein [Gemmatimonadales bacterium]